MDTYTASVNRDRMQGFISDATDRDFARFAPLDQVLTAALYHVPSYVSDEHGQKILDGYEVRWGYGNYVRACTGSLDYHRNVAQYVGVTDDDPGVVHWLEDGKHKQARLSKFLARLNHKYGFTIPPELIARVSELWGVASAPVNVNITITYGNVHDVYEEKYFGSCMHGRPYTRWYDENPDRVGVLTARDKDTGELYARALIWKLPNGTKFMDRLYPGDGGAVPAAVHKWAREQGIPFRVGRGHSDAGDSITFEDVVIEMKPPSNGMYPYMDTMICSVLDPKTNKVYISNDYDALDWVRGRGTASCDLCSTNGSGPHSRNVICTNCGDAVHEDEARYVGNEDAYYCDSCADDRIISVRTRYGYWGWIEEEFDVYSNRIEEAYDGEWYLRDLLVDCPREGYMYPERKCVLLANGDYAPTDADYITALPNGEYGYKDETFVLRDGTVVNCPESEREGLYVEVDGEWVTEAQYHVALLAKELVWKVETAGYTWA